MDGIALAASKTYARGLVFITVYFEKAFYVVVQDGEGDQPLLDVKFPDPFADRVALNVKSQDIVHEVVQARSREHQRSIMHGVVYVIWVVSVRRHGARVREVDRRVFVGNAKSALQGCIIA